MKTTNAILGTLAVALVISAQTQGQTFLTNGLVAHYPFNGNTKDETSRNADGVLAGATLGVDRFGVSNSCLQISGGQSEMYASDIGLPFGNSPRTLSVWVKPDSFSGFIPAFIHYGVKNPDKSAFGIGYSTGGNEYFWSGNYDAQGTRPLLANTWQHCVAVYDVLGKMRLYLDGQLNAQADLPLMNTLSSSLSVGRWYVQGGYQTQFAGSFDDIRIYSRALSASEVQQLYAYETNGLVAYYPFNGNANDESGNGNNCTVSGAQLGTDRFGSASNSYSFAAYPQSLATSGSAGFPQGTNDFSISLWVALNFLTNDHQIVFCNAVANDFQLDVNDTANGTTAPMDFVMEGHYGTADVHTADVPWVPGKWYNLQLVRSLNVVTIYRDSVIIGQSPTVNGVTAAPESRYLQFGLGVPPQVHQLYGQLDDIRIYCRALTPSDLQQLYDAESGPRVDLIKAVKPSFRNLTLSLNYQLQLSGDMNNWTNTGSPFTATNFNMVYPQYFDVDNWGSLYFRLRTVP